MRQHRTPAPTRLAGSIAVLLALAAPFGQAGATTWTVDSCGEGSAYSGNLHGSLRYIASVAVSGDTVDMSALTCSTISLQTGAIHVPQSSLTIKAAGVDKMTVTNAIATIHNGDRVFNHTGTGVLHLVGMRISNGLAYSSGVADGGCVRSSGNVNLTNVALSGCTAISPSPARGGAVFTAGQLTMKYSSITGSSAASSYSAPSYYSPGGLLGYGYGGGAFVSGAFIGLMDTISYNSANYKGRGGGLIVYGNATISDSTINNNYSVSHAGVDASSPTPSTRALQITNSTISYNLGAEVVGGVYTNFASVKILNSTIAQNYGGSAHPPDSPSAFLAGGVAIGAKQGSVSVDIESSIIANNSSNDFSAAYTSASHTITVAGANNIVRANPGIVLSPGIASTACPLLNRLRNNGGPTLTRALASGSPGIDQGNNNGNLPEDQRGLLTDSAPYQYARISGNVTDMGALEVQQGDIVFNSSFEGCP